MPKKYPPEFKRDVVTVARRGDLSVAEVAQVWTLVLGTSLDGPGLREG
jgi:transposase-like protein